MKKMITVGWGVFLVLFGVGLLGWVGYNQFIELQPTAEGRNLLKPTVFGLVVIGVGVARIRGRLKASENASAENGP